MTEKHNKFAINELHCSTINFDPFHHFGINIKTVLELFASTKSDCCLRRNIAYRGKEGVPAGQPASVQREENTKRVKEDGSDYRDCRYFTRKQNPRDKAQFVDTAGIEKQSLLLNGTRRQNLSDFLFGTSL